MIWMNILLQEHSIVELFPFIISSILMYILFKPVQLFILTLLKNLTCIINVLDRWKNFHCFRNQLYSNLKSFLNSIS